MAGSGSGRSVPAVALSTLLVAAAGLLAGGCDRETASVDSIRAAEELPLRIRHATGRRLEALGYSGATGELASPGGVVIHRQDETWPGLNLWSSGQGPVAYLMTMDGELIDRWRLRLSASRLARYAGTRQPHWERVRLLANGDLVGLFEGRSLVTLDRRSRLRWAYLGALRDFDLAPSGEIVVLTAADGAPADERVVWLSPSGEEMRTLSLTECFARSKLSELWGEVSADAGDRAAAGLRVLGETSSTLPAAFAAGNLLIGWSRLGLLAVIDPIAREVAWHRSSGVGRRVDQVLPEALLMFEYGDPKRGSRILEMRPADWTPTWTFAGGADREFFTSQRGSAQRLPNGNTLIAESDRGRALEINRAGDVVWEYVTPIGTGPARNYRASVVGMERLPSER